MVATKKPLVNKHTDHFEFMGVPGEDQWKGAREQVDRDQRTTDNEGSVGVPVEDQWKGAREQVDSDQRITDNEGSVFACVRERDMLTDQTEREITKIDSAREERERGGLRKRGSVGIGMSLEKQREGSTAKTLPAYKYKTTRNGE